METFIRGLVNQDEDNEVNPEIIERAVRGIRMPMEIEHPNATILEFVNEFFQDWKELDTPSSKQRIQRKQ